MGFFLVFIYLLQYLFRLNAIPKSDPHHSSILQNSCNTTITDHIPISKHCLQLIIMLQYLLRNCTFTMSYVIFGLNFTYGHFALTVNILPGIISALPTRDRADFSLALCYTLPTLYKFLALI